MNNLFNRKNLISYTVDTTSNNTLSISVQNGEVVVSAPWYLSNKQIQDAVSEKTSWIISKLKEYEERQNLGYENITLLGKNYITRVYFKHIKTPEVNLNENSIEILLPNQYKNRDLFPIMQSITNKLYSCMAEKEIDSILEKTRLMLGIAPDNFEIKNLKNSLGTVEENNIYISPELFKYRKEIIEYIVAHEFCHLKYKTHSKKFYTMLSKYVPNYEALSKELHSIQY